MSSSTENFSRAEFYKAALMAAVELLGDVEARENGNAGMSARVRKAKQDLVRQALRKAQEEPVEQVDFTPGNTGGYNG